MPKVKIHKILKIQSEVTVLHCLLGSDNLEEVLGTLVQGAVSFPDPTVFHIVLLKVYVLCLNDICRFKNSALGFFEGSLMCGVCAVT